MSSCHQFRCVRKEHDELGCNIACLSKINKLHKQRKTQNVTTALENKQQLFLRETCVHSAAIVYSDDTCGKYLSVLEITEELHRRQNMYLQNSHLSQS